MHVRDLEAFLDTSKQLPAPPNHTHLWRIVLLSDYEEKFTEYDITNTMLTIKEGTGTTHKLIGFDSSAIAFVEHTWIMLA